MENKDPLHIFLMCAPAGRYDCIILFPVYSLNHLYSLYQYSVHESVNGHS